MRLVEFFLTEMSEEDFSVVSRQLVDQFAANKIELIFPTHVIEQVAINRGRAAAVTPKVFAGAFNGILKAWQMGKLDKFLVGLNKKPEVYILFKHKHSTPERRPGVANVPCVILKNNPPYEYKIKALTFMVKDQYMNANFPQDSVMWV